MMRKTLLSLSLCLSLALSVPALAAPEDVEALAAVKADEILVQADDSTGAVIVRSGKKYGACKMDGTQLAAPTYVYARAYSDGMAAVTSTGALKVIDEALGTESFEDGKYGYLDETGALAIPMRYAVAFDFHEGRAFVRETVDGPLRMIDKTGKTVASYPGVDLRRGETVQFSEGLAILPLAGSEDGPGPGSYIAVDETGKRVLTLKDKYVDFLNGYHDGLVAVAEDVSWSASGLERTFNDMAGAGYRNKTGGKVLSGDYDEVRAFSGGMAMVARYDDGWTWRCGFIDTTGKLVVPMEYDRYWDFQNGVGAVGKVQDGNVRAALVDKTGKLLTGFLYTNIWSASEGLIPVRAAGGPIAVLDSGTGASVFATQDGRTGSRVLGGLICTVDSAGKGTVYDARGNDVTPMDFDDFLLTDQGCLWLGKDGTYSVFRTEDLRSAAPARPAFPDVPADHPFAASIAWAAEQGIAGGKADGRFAPAEPCSNGQILTFLWRAHGSPEPTVPDPYTDQIPDAFRKAAVWAYEKGLVSGTTFAASTPCTRAMAVTYLWKLAGSPAAGDGGSFSDVPAGSGFAQAVSWARDRGIAGGAGDGTFGPDRVCSRGQIVTFLYRDLVR